MLPTVLADVIWCLHVALILFVVVIPLTTQKWPILTLHLATIASLMTHWAVEQDTCFLTLVESITRGIHPEHSFVHQIVSPVYRIKDDEIKGMVWWITPVLGLLSLHKLWHQFPLMKRDLQQLRHVFIDHRL